MESMSKNSIPVARQHEANKYTREKNMENVSEETALRKPHPDVNHINWLLGHLACTRLHFLGKVEAHFTDNPEMKSAYAYKTTSTEGEAAFTLAEIEAVFVETDKVIDALITEEGDNDEKMKTIAFMGFHEAYHLGQIGIIRKMVGLPGAI